MGLLSRSNNPTTKKFNAREAIMATVPLHLLVIIQLCIRFPHFSLGPHQASNLELGSSCCYTSYILAIRIILSMP
jgi:hypothetical protein